MTTNTTTAAPTGSAGTARVHDRITVILNVRDANTANPKIYVKTSTENTVCSTNEYPRDHVYQSIVWPEMLRYCTYISVSIDLSSHCASANRIAVNQTLAGLLAFLDAASEFEILQFQVLDGHQLSTTELVKVLQPAAMWIRHMPDVGVKHYDAAPELYNALVEARRLHSRSDDSIERLYGVVRMAARAAGRLHEAGFHAWIRGLNLEMAGIMAGVGFISSTSRAEVEIAVEKVGGVLAKLTESLGGGVEEPDR